MEIPFEPALEIIIKVPILNVIGYAGTDLAYHRVIVWASDNLPEFS